jgi:hypothetical protein
VLKMGHIDFSFCRVDRDSAPIGRRTKLKKMGTSSRETWTRSFNPPDSNDIVEKRRGTYGFMES